MEDEMEDIYMTHNESEIRWASHHDLHTITERGIDKDLTSLKEVINSNLQAHERVHDIHATAHEREHAMTNLAITKAEQSMDRRLDAMNEFRDQLNKQANTFLTREIFDKYTEDMETKVDLALSTLTEKDEAVIRSVVNRHDSDFNSLRELIQAEREIRKAFEGSMNTWKWLAGFLGASGVAGVIILFATKT